MTHERWACTKPPKESTAARKDVPVATGKVSASDASVARTKPAGTQVPPVDTKPRNADRHRPGYFAEYQRKRRAELKTQKPFHSLSRNEDSSAVRPKK